MPQSLSFLSRRFCGCFNAHTHLSVQKREFAVAGRSKPNVLYNMFNKLDKGTTAYSMARFDPTVVLQGHKPLYLNEQAAEYNVTNLNNGFTVLTESSTFPSAVNMGKYLRPLGQGRARVAPTPSF